MYPYGQTYFPQRQEYPQTAGLSCRPVTSREEAVAAQIPFDGSTTYFVDTSNRKIYAKTFDFGTGTAPLVVYSREQEPPPVVYATMEDLNRFRDEILERMEEHV